MFMWPHCYWAVLCCAVASYWLIAAISIRAFSLVFGNDYLCASGPNRLNVIKWITNHSLIKINITNQNKHKTRPLKHYKTQTTCISLRTFCICHLIHWKSKNKPDLMHKHMKTHGRVFNTVATDAQGLKQMVISTNSADYI